MQGTASIAAGRGKIEMPVDNKKEKIKAFYRDLCIGFVGSLRALSLYPPEHPEAGKRVANIYQRLIAVLKQRPEVTILVINGEIVIENMPLPELSKTLAQFIQRMEDMKFQRIVLKKGLGKDEFILFLQYMIQVMKKPENAITAMLENQGRFPHVIAGALPSESGPQISYEELSGALQPTRQTVVSFSGQIKDLFEDIKGPLSSSQIALAREITEAVFSMTLRGDIPLKALIYRRSADRDPYVHAFNVCAFSMALAREIELEDAMVGEIGLAALLHDIGLHVLGSESGGSSQSERAEQQADYLDHPRRGAEILLATQQIPDLAPLVAYEHHIHYDGGGYPKETKHRDLNLASMVTCITDSYDNLRRDAQERRALTLKEAVDWMDRRFGTQFHPILFKKFRAMVKAQAKEEI
jgi:HD-GYP domain-containing protein (c-di-GMP phosphodiesterase class II)